MYGDHPEDEQKEHAPAIRTGYAAVMRNGDIDNPKHNLPAPLPFDPAWRKQPTDGESVIVTNNRYFSDALDNANINLGHEYNRWASVGDCLMHAYLSVYGPNGTKTPLSHMPECQAAFIAVAKASLNDWMDRTDQHTTENRQLYRGLIQQLTWTRVGDLNPR